MLNYGKHLLDTQFDKTRSDQVQNNDGAYVFQVTPFQRLERFLILGAEGGTYYATERKLTRENAACVLECAKLDPHKAVEIVRDVSVNGRAPKQGPAIFALALLASCDQPVARECALKMLPKVCRTASHFFEFISYVDGMRGWGSALRKAVSDWYLTLPDNKLAYQLMKYRQRNGWSHKDVFRKAHPVSDTLIQQALFRWAVGATPDRRVVTRKDGAEVQPATLSLPISVLAFEELQAAKDVSTVTRLIREHNFTHEMVPNEFKNEAKVWEALLPGMPLGALVRNLGKLTAIGLLADRSEWTTFVTSKITDSEQVKRSRLHPMAFLLAAGVYKTGHGVKGKLSWKPVNEIGNALGAGFYLGFGNVQPTGTRRLVALDVSGSMQSSYIAGTRLSAAQATGAMAMVALRTDPGTQVMGFSSSFIDLNLNDGMKLEQVMQRISNLPFSNTDCSIPFRWALTQKDTFQSFEVHTDSETNCNTARPEQVLAQYRQKRRVPAKLAVVAYTSIGFTIADPKDAGMLDCVGFDTATPSILQDFFSNGSKKNVTEDDLEVDSE